MEIRKSTYRQNERKENKKMSRVMDAQGKCFQKN